MSKSWLCWNARRYSFAPSKMATIATVALLLVFISLSHWQWQRADLKSGIISQFNHNKQAPPLTMLDIPDVTMPQDLSAIANLRYRMVNLTGHFLDQHTVFVDNKIHDHVVGFHAITPFLDHATNKLILVDRGFLAQQPNRLDIPLALFSPDVPNTDTSTLDTQLQTITVQLDSLSSKSILLGANEERSWQGSRILQVIDLTNEQKNYNYPLKDYLGLIQSQTAAGLVLPEAAAPYLTPERHVGYALQWATLGLALLIIYLTTNLKRRDEP